MFCFYFWKSFNSFSNVLAGNWREYFSKQNFCEIAMLCLTIAFLVIEWQVKAAEIEDQIENALKNAKGRASYQEMLLGKPFQHWRIISIIHFIKIWSGQLQNFFSSCSQLTIMDKILHIELRSKCLVKEILTQIWPKIAMAGEFWLSLII